MIILADHQTSTSSAKQKPVPELLWKAVVGEKDVKEQVLKRGNILHYDFYYSTLPAQF